MSKVRVRFAPSPTGSPHVGTAYIALFNFIFAQKHGGEFILRIEDTDRKRLVEGAEQELLEALDWLGLKYDEGPIRQSERLKIYQKYAQELVARGAAYEDKGAVRQKVPPGGETSFFDLVRGEISFKNENIDESVLLKSDGYPTYHLGVVVDDHLMGITHIIRGEEWIPSVPKHILMYQALGWEIPKFAHLPLLRDPKRAKLGKRFGDVSLAWFRKEGFLPEALLNYLALLGWTHPEGKEVFPLAEMIEKFRFEDVNKAAPIFDLKKLEWLNGVYIRQKSVDELWDSLKKATIVGKFRESEVKQIIPLIQERMKKLSEFEALTDFFFAEEIKVDPKLLVQEGRTPKETRRALSVISDRLSAVSGPGWKRKKLEEALRRWAKENDWSTKDAFMTLRVALTGKTISPPLFKTIGVLGKEKVLSRVKKAMEILE